MFQHRSALFKGCLSTAHFLPSNLKSDSLILLSLCLTFIWSPNHWNINVPITLLLAHFPLFLPGPPALLTPELLSKVQESVKGRENWCNPELKKVFFVNLNFLGRHIWRIKRLNYNHLKYLFLCINHKFGKIMVKFGKNFLKFCKFCKIL